MAKIPAFQFYTGDWLKDTGILSVAAAGAWIRLLVAMWDAAPRGKLKLSMDAYARLLGTSDQQARALIAELTSVRICENLTEPNGDITLSSRRMVREDKERELNRLRAKKFYDANNKRRPNGNLTFPSSSSSSNLSQKKLLTPPTPSRGDGTGGKPRNQPAESEKFDPSWNEAPWPSRKKLVAMYNACNPDPWPLVKFIGDGLRKKIDDYLRQFPEIEFWEITFGNSRVSKFCIEYHNGSLAWLLQKGHHDGIENCLKVYERKFDR